MRSLILIAHDIRSTHNVGSLLRTAEGLGVEHIYFTGYTPYPSHPQDERLPYIAEKLTRQIHKTALGAEELVPWSYQEDVETVISQLKDDDYTIIGLEQDERAVPLPDYNAPDRCVLLIGREVEGIDAALRALCDDLIEIPMYGSKESFNVVQAAAIATYVLRES